MRTLILSDLHLGHPGTRVTVEQVAPLLDGLDRVVLAGDTVEDRSHWQSKAAADEAVAGLRDLAFKKGVELVFLTGNHDPEISGEHEVLLEAGRVWVLHGDIFFPGATPWSAQGNEMRAMMKQLWEIKENAQGSLSLEDVCQLTREVVLAHPIEPRNEPADLAAWFGHVVHALWPPNRALWVLRSWWSAPGFAAEFAKLYRTAADVIIFGHTHLSGCWTMDNRLVINLGAFVSPGPRPRAVLVEKGRVTVWGLEKQQGGYVRNRCLREFTLRSPQIQPRQEDEVAA
ncbi:MAG: metallophosphoesterase [Verrucomicrobiales bacterium]